MSYEKMSGEVPAMKEDSTEKLPNMVDKDQVDGVEDTDTEDRSAQTDKVAGGGGDVDKKEKTKDSIEKMEDLKKLRILMKKFRLRNLWLPNAKTLNNFFLKPKI